MPSTTSTDRFGSLSIALHWLMLVLLAGVYCAMEFRGLFPKGSDGRTLMALTHFSLGISVYILVWLRIAARFAGPTPAISPAPAAWQNALARLMHLALYAFMIGMPLCGWVMMNTGGKAVPFFGFELPILLAENHALHEQLEELHELGATLGYVLIAAHAAAALFHHYVQKDNTLLRMLPRRS